MLPFTRPTIGEQEQTAIREVLESGWLASGPRVLEFEQALAAYLGNDVTVRVFNSGTSALEASLLASGIGPGDKVIVPAMSFVATANVVVRVGATPVFVDVEPVSRNLDVTQIESVLTSEVKAIMPVHFAGRAADMPRIHEIAAASGIQVIEDAAQAIGTRQSDQPIGASGNPVCFSFHPNKNMTTIEGGAVAVKDEEFVARLERLRFHGIQRDLQGHIDVPEWGGKMNLSDVSAALGLVQLARLDEFNQRRRELACRYLKRLPRHPALTLPEDVPGHSWHMFCVALDFAQLNTDRSTFQQALQAQGIATGTHYPAIHLFSLYRRYGYNPGDFPVTERIAKQTLTLPLFPQMTDEDVDRVCNAFSTLLEATKA